MAIAGGACSAYQVQVRDRQVHVKSTTMLRDLCVKVDDALLALSRGEIVTVAGGDMVELRRRLDIALGQEVYR